MGCISTMKEISDSYGLPNGWNEEIDDMNISLMTLGGMVDTMPNSGTMNGWQAPYKSALVDTFYWFDPFAEDEIASNFIYAYNYYRGSK